MRELNSAVPCEMRSIFHWGGIGGVCEERIEHKRRDSLRPGFLLVEHTVRRESGRREIGKTGEPSQKKREKCARSGKRARRA
ncbi:MAG: hypothetical protein JRI72_03045 [Deltaproteobacteria bacterium]|nr:hypothetical protein [Deltaproteobacteria bacterium]